MSHDDGHGGDDGGHDQEEKKTPEIQKYWQKSNCREFLGQAWMKEDKKKLAPNISLITERFNDVSFTIVIFMISIIIIIMIILMIRPAA